MLWLLSDLGQILSWELKYYQTLELTGLLIFRLCSADFKMCTKIAPLPTPPIVSKFPESGSGSLYFENAPLNFLDSGNVTIFLSDGCYTNMYTLKPFSLSKICALHSSISFFL